MKLPAFIILLIIPLLPQKIFESFDLNADHSFAAESTYEFPMLDQGDKMLIMDEIVGDIHIKGQNTSQVIVLEEIRIHHSSRIKANKVFAEEKATITHFKDSNIIKIAGPKSDYGKIFYAYTITLPLQFNLDIKISGGDIDIDHISGEVDLRTSGGDIDIADIMGRVTARTAGGDITVDESQGAVNVSTSGGDIDIKYTEGNIEGKTSGGDLNIHRVQGKVNVETSGGSIYFSDIKGQEITGITSGGNIKIEDIQGNIEIRTSGGEISAKDVTGNLKGSTSSGDIELRSIDGNLSIETNAGDIFGNVISGSINAQAASGDIKIIKHWNKNLEDHFINIQTSYGDLEISLPSQFPATIEAVIAHKWFGHTIDSELPLHITRTEDIIQGKLIVADGRHKVNLKAIQGNIIIKED